MLAAVPYAITLFHKQCKKQFFKKLLFVVGGRLAGQFGVGGGVEGFLANFYNFFTKSNCVLLRQPCENSIFTTN